MTERTIKAPEVAESFTKKLKSLAVIQSIYRRRVIVLGVLVCSLSLTFRLCNLNQQGIDCEETYTIAASTGHHYRYQTKLNRLDAPRPIEDYRRLLRVDDEHGLREVTDVLQKNVHLPSYFYLMHYWIRWFGTSAFSLRFPSAIFGALAVLATFLLALELFTLPVAIMSATLIGFMPQQLFYSQEARMYSLIVLLAASSTYALVLANKQDSSAWPYVLYGIASIAGLFTHHVYAFCVASQCLSVLTTVLRTKERITRWFTTYLGIALASSPVLVFSLSQRKTAPGTLLWIHGDLGLGALLDEIVRNLTQMISVPDAPLGSLSVAAGYVLLLCGLFWVRSSYMVRLLLILSVIVPLAGILILDRVFGTQGIAVLRYWLVVSPALSLLVAAGVQRLRNRRLRMAFVSVVVVFLSVCATQTAAGKLASKPDEHKRLAEYLDDRTKGNDKQIVLTEGSPAIPLAIAYYSSGNMQLCQFNLLTAADSFPASLRDASVVWLVINNQSYAARMLKDAGFRSVESPSRFGHIVVYRYEVMNANSVSPRGS